MKHIFGYHGLYKINKIGQVWSLPKINHSREGKFLKPWLIGNGYECVMLYKNRISKKFLVHRLVAINYIPNPNKLPEVNHINGDRLDNRIENLEWCTSKQNKKSAWDNGQYTHRGENHWNHKITSVRVKQLKEKFRNGKTVRQLADYHKLPYGYIYRIVTGRRRIHG